MCVCKYEYEKRRPEVKCGLKLKLQNLNTSLLFLAVDYILSGFRLQSELKRKKNVPCQLPKSSK